MDLSSTNTVETATEKGVDSNVPSPDNAGVFKSVHTTAHEVDATDNFQQLKVLSYNLNILPHFIGFLRGFGKYQYADERASEFLEKANEYDVILLQEVGQRLSLNFYPYENEGFLFAFHHSDFLLPPAMAAKRSETPRISLRR